MSFGENIKDNSYTRQAGIQQSDSIKCKGRQAREWLTLELGGRVRKTMVMERLLVW